jgi:multimeric flavodoxin WrbA
MMMANVLILYHSQEHGNTQAMAEAVAEGARAAGARITMHNTHEERLDIDRYREFDAVAFGSPDYFSYIAGGMKVFLDDWYLAGMNDESGLGGKPYGLFLSHGGGGAARPVMEKLFERMGSQVGKTVESTGRPNAEVLDQCRALGRQLA